MADESLGSHRAYVVAGRGTDTSGGELEVNIPEKEVVPDSSE